MSPTGPSEIRRRAIVSTRLGFCARFQMPFSILMTLDWKPYPSALRVPECVKRQYEDNLLGVQCLTGSKNQAEHNSSAQVFVIVEAA